MTETIGRRILGAIRCVDATTGNLVTGIEAASGVLVLNANQSGVFCILGGGLGAAWPDVALYEVFLHDPRLFYLPRRVVVKAPQGASASDMKSLAQAQTVQVYRGPSARVELTWAVIHASISRAGGSPSDPGLPWAAILVRNADQSILATGMSDGRGEALVAIPGLSMQVSANGSGAVMQPLLAATVEVLFDPGASTRPAGWIPNPDDILANPAGPWKTTSQDVQLSAGQTLFLKFAIAV